MKAPRLIKWFITAIVMLGLASISIAPTGRRIPVLDPSGNPVLGTNGSPLKQFDWEYYWSVNWFGLTLMILSFAILACLLLYGLWLAFTHWLRRKPTVPSS